MDRNISVKPIPDLTAVMTSSIHRDSLPRAIVLTNNAMMAMAMTVIRSFLSRCDELCMLQHQIDPIIPSNIDATLKVQTNN
jgi:hypothetical protein